MTSIKCVQCGMAVEAARECYATPVCYVCLPPPKPLPVASLHKKHCGPECPKHTGGKCDLT